MRPMFWRRRAAAPPQMVWMFGSPRSGNTWLMHLLSDHEQVFKVNEPLIGDHLGPFLCDRPAVGAPDFDLGNFTVRRRWHDSSDYFFADAYRDVWEPLLGRLLRDRLGTQVERELGRGRAARVTVLIKEPNGSQSADMILSALPDAGLLFLVRDGRDVVDSTIAAAASDSWLAELGPVRGIRPGGEVEFAITAAHKWLWQTEVVEEAFAAHTGRKLMLRYEDLLDDTPGELRRIYDWLGLEASDGLIQDSVERRSFDRIPADRRGPRRFHRAATPGLWRESLRSEIHEAIGPVLEPKLRELGYKI